MSSPLSGFTAVPNPQMLAFMPIQSYLMMYFAGAGWQIGKRKISAIPNEEFNKMSANDLLKGFTADLRQTIPTLEKSLQDITPLIKILIAQYGDFIKEAIAAAGPAVEVGLRPTFEQAGLIPTKESTAHLPTLDEWLRKNFQFLPVAEARLSADSQTGQRTGNFGTSQFQKDFIGPSKETTQQRANRLNAEHNQQVALRKASEARIAAANQPKISTVHQTAIQQFKPKAGQTQLQELARLQATLLQQSKNVKEASANARRTTQGRQYSLTWNRRLTEARAAFNKTQTLLSGLVARYRF